jgi:hypothetical protein
MTREDRIDMYRAIVDDHDADHLPDGWIWCGGAALGPGGNACWPGWRGRMMSIDDVPVEVARAVDARWRLRGAEANYAELASHRAQHGRGG